MLFTTPYYDNSALFVGQQGKYTSVDQLKGKSRRSERDDTPEVHYG